MATKRIETQLTVKAVDQYSRKINSMSAVTGRFADKVRSEMSRLQAIRGPLRMIEDFEKQRAVVRRSGEALEVARERQRRLLAEIRATRNPSARLRREFDRARASSDRLEQQHRKNRTALHGLQVKLRDAGVNTRDLAGEQRRLTSALDSANASMKAQVDRMERVDVLQRRLANGRQRMDRSLATAANVSFVGSASFRTGERMLTQLSRISDRAGDLEDQFAEFQNLTGIGDSRLSQLRGELDDLRDITKSSVPEMLAGLGVLVGKGMGFEDALDALPAAARAAKATRTEFDEMGAAGFALFDNLGVAPEELSKAFDVMAMGGKEGGFELSAMARKFPEITAGARALKMEGIESVAQITAALQVAMKSAGSEDQAATNMSNFLGKITSPETVRRFAKFGVSIEDELKKAAENGTSPFEHMLGVIEDVSGGDALKMGELFGDKQVLDFLRAMIPNMEEYRRIREAALSADGVVDKDFANLLDTFKESKAQLGESIGKLFSLPPEVLEDFTDLLQSADKLVERMIVWKEENPELVKGLFLGATALGALALAGGAFLTASAGVMGTLAVMRFGLTGLAARAAFAAGNILGLGGIFRGMTRLPHFVLSSLIAPVRWSSRLIPRIPWLRLVGGRFVLSSLVKPLTWTSRLLPSFAPALARFAAFRSAASSEMSGLRRAVSSDTAAMQRNLSQLRLNAIGTGMTTFLAMQAIPDDPEEVGGFQEENVRSMDKFFRAIPGVGGLMSLQEGLYKRVHGVAPPVEAALLPQDAAVRSAAQAVQSVGASGDLPTVDRIAQLRAEVAAYRKEVEAAQSALDATPETNSIGVFNSARIDRQADLDSAVSGLRRAEEQLSSAETASSDLTEALRVLNGTEVAPVISTESIDRALSKVQSLAANMRSLPRGGASASGQPKPAGARAGGGPVRAGLPYLVNENTPRSEWFVPSQSGAILNVSQAQGAFRSHFAKIGAGLGGSGQGLRAASLAMALGAALPAAAAGGAGSPARVVSINIGSVNIPVPQGVTDPHAIAELAAEYLGRRIEETAASSFAD